MLIVLLIKTKGVYQLSEISTILNSKSKIPQIDSLAPNKLETFTCALGCFWAPDCKFGVTEGVVRTRVGYAGGATKNPTYHNLGDHIETVQIDYDPAVISFEELLSMFWSSHKPTRTVWKRQYATALFFHNEHQEKLARETRDKISCSIGESVQTEIIPFNKFYMAEMYHQKYHLQGYEGLMAEYREIYTEMADIVNSTSAARVNGYIGGYGDVSKFNEDFSTLGLSEDKENFLNDIIKKNQR